MLKAVLLFSRYVIMMDLTVRLVAPIHLKYIMIEMVRTAGDIIGDRDIGCSFVLQICHHDRPGGQVSSAATL